MKRSLKVVLWIVLSLAVILAAFYVFINVEGPLSDVSAFASDLDALAPRNASIEGFGVIAQPDAASCGVTTVCMVESYFSGKTVEPETLIQKYGLTGGMNTDTFSDLVSREGYEAEYKSNLSDPELIKEIYAQLRMGMPVAVFFGAENPYNKPYYDFHASVVTGVDLNNETIDIANAYGYNETISLSEFLDRTSYRKTNKYPLVQKAVLKLGLMDRNAIFTFIQSPRS